MYIWNPLKLKELKEKGYKIKIYKWRPEFRDQTIEEFEAHKATSNKPTSAQAQADKRPSHKPKGSGEDLPPQEK